MTGKTLRSGVFGACLIGLAATVVLGAGLGRSLKLSYHEAIVVQAAREMLARGDYLVPTIGGTTWVEKPPLPFWLVMLTSRLFGSLDEFSARVPSAVAGALTAMGVALIAFRRFGPTVGLLAGLIQITTSWMLLRGRLAEADVLLACLVTWSFVFLDRIRAESGEIRRATILAFFLFAGATSLTKGIGFGEALIFAAVGALLVWDRDSKTFRALTTPWGWALLAILTFAWPIAVIVRVPAAWQVWAIHVTDRLSSRPKQFAGGPWWEYGPALLGQTLPWTPLALWGAWISLKRAIRERGGGDRLLWAWAVVPVALLSLATIKNGYYAIHALPPWSIWAAFGMSALGEHLIRRYGRTASECRQWAISSITIGCLLIGGGYYLLGPRLDARGVEWAFYEQVGRRLDPSVPVVFIYDDWDREPYPTPFGPVPHDLAVRLFYLGPDRRVSWRVALDPPADFPAEPFVAVARARDLPALRALGRVEPLDQGPPVRADRTYASYRIEPIADLASAPDRLIRR